LSDITVKADHCNRLVKDKYLQGAFRDVRDAIHQQFERASVEDVATLVGLKHKLNLLDSVWANLELAIENGKLEVWNEEQAKISYLGEASGR
jgi:hypothetical protein